MSFICANVDDSNEPTAYFNKRDNNWSPFVSVFKEICSTIYSTRIWIGLFVCLLCETYQVVVSLLIQENKFHCPNIDMMLHVPYTPLIKRRFGANIKIIINNTDSCDYICSHDSVTIANLLSTINIIPLVMQGLSSILIFMMVLEFICAQSPNVMRGFLIEIWYSMLSIKYIIINNLDILHPSILETFFLLEYLSWL